jgi:adenylate cyclase
LNPDDHAGREEIIAKLREVRGADRRTALFRAVKLARELLPGDSELGDPLSTAGDAPTHLLARQVTEHGAGSDSVVRELGLGALQVWQALSEAQGRGRGDVEVTIVFTDLVDFSSWALEAGDEAVLELLRRVGLAVEPTMKARGGRVVKRLGDGLMAVFGDPAPAVEATLESCRNVAELEVEGHQPALRAGLHVGRPRQLGGDYLGVDVNIAARVAAAARGGEVLISETTRSKLGGGVFDLQRQRRFKAKGAPKDLQIYSVSSR